MRPFLLLLAMWLLTGCYSTPPPTPYPLQEYPATWTLAPTPTNTPPGPTATLVIQRTPFALPTRDPNARLLPTVSRGAIGLWAEIADNPSPLVQELAGRAQVLISQNSPGKLRKNNQFLIFKGEDAQDNAFLAPEFNGIVLTSDTIWTADKIAGLRQSVSPRLVLASALVTDTARLDAVVPNTDGVLLQNFLRAADTPPDRFPDQVEWKNAVDSLAARSANPETVILVSTPPDTQGTLSQQWFNFALASFLLGANNSHTFFGIAGANQPNVLLPNSQTEPGVPMGETFKTNGVYQRRFSRGLVVVNPTGDKHTLIFSSPYRDAANNTLTQLEMPAHTGAILTLAGQ